MPIFMDTYLLLETMNISARDALTLWCSFHIVCLEFHSTVSRGHASVRYSSNTPDNTRQRQPRNDRDDMVTLGLGRSKREANKKG